MVFVNEEEEGVYFFYSVLLHFLFTFQPILHSFSFTFLSRFRYLHFTTPETRCVFSFFLHKVYYYVAMGLIFEGALLFSFPYFLIGLEKHALA